MTTGNIYKLKIPWDFPGSSVVKTPHIPTAGGPGSIPSWETRSHMPQLRVYMLQQRQKILRATAKTWNSQIKKNIKINK